ncbi:MAG: polysaccharide biosynthesis protein GtrA, partial [Pseudomonadales bacterium]|nr:polysaccharide biosynthesis protein GtrA [Pseudomonadales bacterium]
MNVGINQSSLKRISGFIAAGGMATLFHWAAMSGLVLLGMA